MQTTLRINDTTYREAKAEAARCGVTMTQFLEDALRLKIATSRGEPPQSPESRREIKERNQLMEALLKRTARFRVGPHPTREELNAR
jgi:hypothetical protein